jgi:hypothetical protein
MNGYARISSKARRKKKNSSGEKGLHVNQKTCSEYDTRGLSAMIRTGHINTGIQKKEEKRKEIQPKLLQCKNKDDDKVQEKMIQCKEEKKEPVQAKMVHIQKKEEEEKVQTLPLHMKKEEEEKLQTKPLQKKEDEEKVQLRRLQMKKEEEKVQNKPILLKREESTPSSGGEKKSSGNDTDKISSFLQATRHAGVPLPDSVRTFMEKKFNADFSQVRIHADSDAAHICKSLKALAFTHGNHIYFNNGKYNPASEQGRSLLAHELTHVLQQKSM